MAQEQSEQERTTEKQTGAENGSTNGGHGGFKTAAAASIAAGMSYMLAKRALDQRGSGSSSAGSSGRDEKHERQTEKGGRTSDSLRSAVDALTWDRAQEMLVPLAERAASAAGSYAAREAPEIVSDRLIPRFIDAFNKVRSRDS